VSVFKLFVCRSYFSLLVRTPGKSDAFHKTSVENVSAQVSFFSFRLGIALVCFGSTMSFKKEVIDITSANSWV
jgi:hypothetical protein